MKHYPGCFALAMFLCAFSAFGATQIGETTLARGATTAESSAGEIRILGKNAPIYQGDVVSTGPRSFAMVSLEDGTKMTLRPNTVFKFEEFNVEPKKERSVVRLFKGGMRTVTGYLSKRNPNAFKMRTAVATIGIRGTEFDARLCATDCAEEAETVTVARGAPVSKVVGRVGFVNGSLTRDRDGQSQRLSVGASIHEGDKLTTDSRSVAVLAFRDEARVTLTQNSEFLVEEYRYDAVDPQKSLSALRLLSGGLRAVTGLIGASNPNGYRVSTAVATIGIRGTGFDIICQDDCAAETQASPTRTQSKDLLVGFFRMLIPNAFAQTAPEGPGFYASVWDGDIVISNLPGSDLLIAEGEIYFVPVSGAPIMLDTLPVNIDAPLPTEVDIDQEEFFGTEEQDDPEPGLYVSCYTGECDLELEDEIINLGDGEAAFADESGQNQIRLELIPPFQSNDPWLDEQTLLLYNGLLNDVGDIGSGEFQCNIQ